MNAISTRTTPLPLQRPPVRAAVVSPWAAPAEPTEAPPPLAPPATAEVAAPRRRWIAALGIAGLLGLSMIPGHPAPVSPVEATTMVDARVSAPKSATVAVYGSHTLHYPIAADFPRPILLERHQVKVEVEIPPPLAGSPPVVVTMFATDVNGHKQHTSWADGEVNPGNAAYDARSGRLTLTVRPTRAAVDPQGSTDAGFDPSKGIKSIGLDVKISPLADGGFRHGTVRVRAIRVEDAPPIDQTLPIERPLLKAERAMPHPLQPKDVTYGVSRFFGYGDLHRWAELAPQARESLARQQSQRFDAFRLMGGFDTRTPMGHGRAPGRAEFDATESFLETARQTGQKHTIIAMFDGAIANDVLRRAMTDPDAGRQLIDEWRPWIHQFGNRQIDGQPVIFDLVNEIHGMGGVTLRQRQVFVENLMDAFAQEAPGATVTLGVASYKDLTHWTYLLERCQGQPIHFIPTFHVWDDFDKVPPAWQLNLPPGTTVGITEADPRAGVQTIVKKAADKGYPWLLFWTDGQHPYDAAQHRAAVDAVQRAASTPKASEAPGVPERASRPAVRGGPASTPGSR